MPASVCAFSRSPTERTSSRARRSLRARSRRRLVRGPARLALGGLGHDERLLRERELGADVLVDDPDEDVPLLHALALAHGEALDPPADLRAQRGAPSRLHRPGPAPGDGLLDGTARGGDDRDGNRARAGSSVSRRRRAARTSAPATRPRRSHVRGIGPS